MFFEIGNGVLDAFAIIGFGFGFILGSQGNNEVSFAHINPAVVLRTHHKPALHSDVCRATVRLC